MRIILAIPLLLATSVAFAQNQSPKHNDAVDARGDQVMGFSHARTAHHFTLTKDGGVISASSAKIDQESVEAIRGHFQHIAHSFAMGDFNAPMLIHGRVPPGVNTMKRLKGEISYAFEPQPDGGAIHISSHDPVAVAAVHRFLIFQIKDHRTGDTTRIQ